MAHWLIRLGFGMAMAFCGNAMAFIPPPEPLHISFEAGIDRLSVEGRIAVDRLAVRAARCEDGPLRVAMSHSRSTPPSLVTARTLVVQARLARLGLKAVYVTQPTAGQGDAMDAVVTVHGNEYCDRDNSAVLQQWAEEMARVVRRPASGMPTFWRRMSPQVRQRDLALPLAVAAYCGAAVGSCRRNPVVLEWLTDHVARHAAMDDRQRWLWHFWTLSVDPDLARLQARLALPSLSAMDRSCLLAEIGQSDLPWETLERRVMQPDLIALLQDYSACFVHEEFGPFIAAAVRNRRMDVVEQLIDATKVEKPGLLAFAITAAVGLPDEVDFEAAMGRLTAMVGTVYGSGGAKPVVDRGTATLHLLVGAHCPQVVGWASASPSRYGQVWDRLIQAGFVPEPDVLSTLTTTGFFAPPQRCRLERVPGEPLRFRPAPSS